jgi:hypothetical protein
MRFCGVNRAIFPIWKIATDVDETGARFVIDDCRRFKIVYQVEKKIPLADSKIYRTGVLLYIAFISPSLHRVPRL